MSIRFSPATPERFQEVCALYQDVIRDMHSRGLKQWEWDVYPTRAQLEEDVTHGRLYRVEDEGRLIAAALGGKHGVFRVGYRLTFGGLPHEAFTAFGESNNG